MAMTETYRDFTIFDEHIQRFTARTALAWKIHSRQVQIPKHTADLSPACASVLAASSRELRMNWHIWHQREEADISERAKSDLYGTDSMISREDRRTSVNCRRAHRPPRPRPRPKL